jgi:hypothetical protein
MPAIWLGLGDAAELAERLTFLAGCLSGGLRGDAGCRRPASSSGSAWPEAESVTIRLSDLDAEVS